VNEIEIGLAQVAKKLAEIENTSANATDTENGRESGPERPEIGQLRMQIHLYQNVIEEATDDQKKLWSAIGVYQSRIAMSLGVEEQYKLLTRDNDNALAFYQDLLAKKNTSEVSSNMEKQQMGEQLRILAAAGLPAVPNFPNRPLFALWGLSAGVFLGIGRLLWPASRKLYGRLDLLFPFDTEPE
jgi:hypothetical protein